MEKQKQIWFDENQHRRIKVISAILNLKMSDCLMIGIKDLEKEYKNEI